MIRKSALIVMLAFSVPIIGFKSGDRFEENKIFNPGIRAIFPNVYLFNDVCNVFVLKSGNSALLIDAGSGEITNYLKGLGIKNIEWVLHTHYHRDQCIGSAGIKKTGAKIAIGELEADLLDNPAIHAPFEIPEVLLLNGELPGWGKRLAPFSTPGVDKKFTGGEEFAWNQFNIKVISTPGHTEGSVSYLVETEGQSFCFTGDLIIKGGYVRDLYSMQWTYLQNPGIGASISSLKKIKDAEPEALLPSHGAVINDPSSEIDILNERLEKVRDAFTFQRAGRWNWSEFVQVSKHVVQDGGSTSQIILSDSGDALLFDCGKGFSPERLLEAKTKFGVKRVAVIIPSHWHYDHIDGIRAMAEAEGAEVWAWEGLAEHLEHPDRFPTTCWTGKSIKVDRVLRENEEFEWGGYSFKVYHHPVHMEEQMGLLAKVDGLDFYMIADGTGYSKEGHIRSVIHCYNGVRLSSGLIKTARSFYEANPYICLPAHSNVFAVGKDDREEFIRWAEETTAAIRSLLSPPFQDLGFDPYWASFYPARVRVRAGEETTITLRIKNYSELAVTGKFRLKTYGHLLTDKNISEFQLAPGETKDFHVTVNAKKKAGKGIHLLTADIEYNKQRFAEYPQAYIEIDN